MLGINGLNSADVLLSNKQICVTLTSMSELFMKVASRSIIDFIKETAFYRKI